MAIHPVTKGFSYSGTSPNNVVTATNLNALVDNATIGTSLITEQTAITVLATDDLLLAYDTSAATFAKITATNAIPSAKAVTGSTQLTMNYTGATTVDITAAQVLMRSATNALFYASGFTSTLDMSVFGVNGRDFSGSITANTWFYIYAISDGTNNRSLLSASATSPTLPNGYLYFCLLGVGRANSSSQFVPFIQHGNTVGIGIRFNAGNTSSTDNPYTNGGDFTAVAPVSAGDFQTVDLSRCIPPSIVSRVRGVLGTTQASVVNRAYAVASAWNAGTLAAPDQNTIGIQIYDVVTLASAFAAGFTGLAMFDVPVKTSQVIYWTCGNASSSTHNMRITGYDLAL